MNLVQKLKSVRDGLIRDVETEAAESVDEAIERLIRHNVRRQVKKAKRVWIYSHLQFRVLVENHAARIEPVNGPSWETEL